MSIIGGTWWRSVREPVGERFEADWSTFQTRFFVPRVARDKQLLPGWAPVTFFGNRRRLSAVEECTAIGLDIDHAQSFKEICAPWAGLQCVIHTTFAHWKDAPRARVVIPISRPVDALTYTELWHWAAGRACIRGGCGPDEAAKDPSRLWFAPGVHPNGEYQLHIGNGKVVDVDRALAEQRTQQNECVAKVERPATIAHVSNRDVTERARNYVRKCDPAISGQRGSSRTFIVAQKLVRGFCLSPDAALELLLSDYNPRCVPPWSKAELVHKVQQAATFGRVPVGSLLGAA